MNRAMKETWGWVKAIVIAVIIALVIRNFVFSNYIVRGDSMRSTLQNGNRLIVNMLDYRFSSPHRFDVIVFHATPTEDYVKRIIGLPGDTIRYSHDQLYVNGKKVAEPYLQKNKAKMPTGVDLTQSFSLHSLTGSYRVPKGKLWVMGDNRRNSEDSRYFGFVDESKVVGKVSLRYWPFDEFGSIPFVFLNR
ncbi:MAG: signal peptidase I [Sporolactobacillus sp.]